MKSSGLLGLGSVPQLVGASPTGAVFVDDSGVPHDDVRIVQRKELYRKLDKFIRNDTQCQNMGDLVKGGGSRVVPVSDFKDVSKAIRFPLLAAWTILNCERVGAYTERSPASGMDAYNMASRLVFGDIYVWSEETQVEALRMTLPRDMSLGSIPLPSAYSTHILPCTVRLGGLTASMVYVSRGLDDTVNCGVMCVSPAGVDLEVSGSQFKYTDATKPGEKDESVIALLPAKMLLFAGSPYVPKRTARLPRSSRRKLERCPTILDPEKTVTWLDLRHVQQDRPSTGIHKEWSHHWAVRGHLRRVGPKKVWTYIRPHIRGDLTKPFLDHCYRVKR